MKIFKILIIATLLSLTSHVNAHADHGQIPHVEISQPEAIMIAMDKVSQKIESKDLDSSWETTQSKTATLERLNGRKVWKVSLTHTDTKTPKILNVFISKTGDFLSISQ